MIKIYRYKYEKLLIIGPEEEEGVNNNNFFFIGKNKNLNIGDTAPIFSIYRDYEFIINPDKATEIFPNLGQNTADLFFRSIFRYDSELLNSLLIAENKENLEKNLPSYSWSMSSNKNRYTELQIMETYFKLRDRGIINDTLKGIDWKEILKRAQQHDFLNDPVAFSFFFMQFLGEDTWNMIDDFLSLNPNIRERIILQYDLFNNDDCIHDQILLEKLQDDQTIFKFLPEKLKIGLLTLGMGSITPEEIKKRKLMLENKELEWKKERAMKEKITPEELERRIKNEIHESFLLGHVYQGPQIKSILEYIYDKYKYPKELGEEHKLNGIEKYFCIQKVRGGYRFDFRK